MVSETAAQSGAALHPDLEKTISRTSRSNIPDEALLASDADAELLAKLGYKQELRRNFTMIEVFGIAFSIIGLLPSIASTLSFSIPAGPAGMVWGWFLAGMFIFIVGVAMADLGSAMPTSGGLYWWTHYFASPKTRNALSFLVGYSNTLGLVGGLCSIDYGFSLMFCSVIVVARDGNWTPSNGVVYAVFLACVICHGILASTLSKVMGKLQTVFVIMNFIFLGILVTYCITGVEECAWDLQVPPAFFFILSKANADSENFKVLITATIIALPIGRHNQRNDAHFIFAETENLTTWPTGWAFMLAWLSTIWTIGGFDSCVHMSEEAANAAKAVPYGIMMAVGTAWIMGFIILIVIAATIDPNLEAVLGTSFGQPMAQIYYDAVGKKGTLGFMSLLFICQFLMGLSILVAASRQSWAFSRDGALPFSSFFRPISKRFGYIPFRTIWGCVFLAAILGLLCLIAPAAASALFSLAVAGNNLAYLTPIFCRIFWGQDKFVPGPFYTGDRLSRPIAWLAVIFLVFGITLAMFPVGGPNPTPQSMNYTIVINSAVWVGALLYYFIDARKWFTGPKITIDTAGMTEEQQEVLEAEGVNVINTAGGDDKTSPPGYEKNDGGIESA